MVLFYLLLPPQVELDWSWQTLISAATQDWRWLEHLTNFFYALVLVVWEPVYVACGFSLYLNRRTVLEAWDIELTFRRLRQRLSSAAMPLLLAVLLLTPTAQTAWATEPIVSPDSPRLVDQPLSSQASRDSIKAILDQPPFKNRETVTRYRFGEDTPTAAPSNNGRIPEWLTALLNLSTTLIEVVLWGTVVGTLAFLIWRYRDWLQAFVSRRPALNGKVPRPRPQQAFGLDLDRDTLPADIAGSAEDLWQTHPREALGLLYRALLSHLLHDFDMALKPADTEGQVLERVERLQQPELLAFSKKLTGHWQNMAYGHRLPPAPAQQELCDGWRALFDQGAVR
jgi:heme/copper-type cytochrome/quinol oxidase subunit 2